MLSPSVQLRDASAAHFPAFTPAASVRTSEEGEICMEDLPPTRELDSTSTFSFKEVRDEPEEPEIWTRAAKIFMFSISAFAFSTILLLISLLVIQARTPLVKILLGGTLNDVADFNSNKKYYAYVGDRKNIAATIHTIIAELFLVGSGYVAVKTRNTFSIFAVVLYNTYLVFVGFVEVQQRREGFLFEINNLDIMEKNLSKDELTRGFKLVRGLVWAVPVVDLSFHIGCDWGAWGLYKEIGWSIYKKVSADLRLRRLYRNYLIMSSLLLFSAFFSVMQVYFFTFDMLLKPLWDDLPAKSWIPSSFARCALYLGACYGQRFAARREIPKLMLVCLLLQLAYLGWSAAFIETIGKLWISVSTPTAGRNKGAQILFVANMMPAKLLTQTIVSDLLAVLSLIYSVIVFLGFGQGLRAVYPRNSIFVSKPMDLSEV